MVNNSAAVWSKMLYVLLGGSSLLFVSGTVMDLAGKAIGKPLFFFGSLGLIAALSLVFAREHNLKQAQKQRGFTSRESDLIHDDLKRINRMAWIMMAWIFSLFGFCFFALCMSTEHIVSGSALTIMFMIGAGNAVYQAITANRRDAIN